MSQEAQVRVAGPSRGVLAAATGALVALTSGATAFVVLTGTGGMVPAAPSLDPLPPAAAPPAHPPVVVLPPGALGLAVPAQPDGPRATSLGGARRTTTFVLAAPPASVGLRALLPELPDVPPPAAAPAPAPVVVPGTASPSGKIDPKLVRRLEKTLERRQDLLPGRETLSDTTDATMLDLLGALTPRALTTTAERQWDEQDEREQRHARAARRAVPAIPAVVTGSRAVPAVPAVPAAAAQPSRPVPAVAEQRSTGAPQQRATAAASKTSKKATKQATKQASKQASKKAARPAGTPPGKDRATAKQSAGKSKSAQRAPRPRSGGPRP